MKTNFSIHTVSIICFLFFSNITFSSNEDALKAEPTSPFKNTSEAGLLIASGNSNINSIHAKQINTFEWTVNLFRFDGQFLKSKTNKIESARYWLLGLRYERSFSKSLKIFLAEFIESDIYSGYKARFNSDLGIKVELLKKTNLTWSAELGYRFTFENRVIKPNIETSHLRAFSELKNNWNKYFNTHINLEYLLSLSQNKSFQLNGEIALSTIITEVLSVKNGFTLKFDNKPAPNVTHKTDTVFTTALVAQF